MGTEEQKEETTENISSNENAQSESIKKSDSEHSSEHLSRHERRKLMKEQQKEQKGIQHEQAHKRQVLKKIITYSIIAALLIGGYFGVKALTAEKLPTADDDPFFGPSESKVTVIEFGDLQCPYTRSFNTEKLKRIRELYGSNVKWVFRDMPTGRHQFSNEAALAAQCANEQGKFWEYHDIIFEKQAGDEASLKSYAKILELDITKFNECFNSGRYKGEVMKDYRDGRKAGVQLTPTFFVNGIKLQGDLPFHIIKNYIDQELAR